MKKSISSILLILSCYAAFAQQSIKISTLKGAKIVKNNNENSYPIYIDKDDKGKFIYSIKEGYITKIVEADELIQKGDKEFVFNMTPISKPVLGKSLKKMKFASIVDKGNRLLAYYYGSTLIQSVNLKDVKYNNCISKVFSNNGYNLVSPENEWFKEKTSEADLILAAELVGYDKDTKGTPGFKISMALRWSIFDVSEEKVVMKVLTGGFTDEGRRMTESEAFLLAAEDAVLDLANNPDFIKLVDKDASKAALVNFAKFSLPVIPSPVITESNNYIENSVKSVITIKTNSGHGSGFVVSSTGYVLLNAHVF